ncbi:MAG: N-acyl homoserine lactonase family protein [Phycisphaerales bacterium]
MRFPMLLKRVLVACTLLILIWCCSITDTHTSTHGSLAQQRERLLNGDLVRIYAFDGGSTTIADKSVFHPSYKGEGSFEISVRSFLIVHQDGILLWDTGLPDTYINREVRQGITLSTLSKTLLEQLQELELSPKNIDYIALSHFHYDHSGNANYFPTATLLVAKNEYELAFGEQAENVFGLMPGTYETLRDTETHFVNDELDVFGDGRVRILPTPGHTIGSQALMVNLQENGLVILSGDLWHFESQRAFSRVPSFNASYHETLESMRLVDQILSCNPNSQIWITHDPEQMGELTLSPHSYR